MGLTARAGAWARRAPRGPWLALRDARATRAGRARGRGRSHSHGRTQHMQQHTHTACSYGVGLYCTCFAQVSKCTSTVHVRVLIGTAVPPDEFESTETLSE